MSPTNQLKSMLDSIPLNNSGEKVFCSSVYLPTDSIPSRFRVSNIVRTVATVRPRHIPTECVRIYSYTRHLFAACKLSMADQHRFTPTCPLYAVLGTRWSEYRSGEDPCDVNFPTRKILHWITREFEIRRVQWSATESTNNIVEEY